MKRWQGKWMGTKIAWKTMKRQRLIEFKEKPWTEIAKDTEYYSRFRKTQRRRNEDEEEEGVREKRERKVDYLSGSCFSGVYTKDLILKISRKGGRQTELLSNMFLLNDVKLGIFWELFEQYRFLYLGEVQRCLSGIVFVENYLGNTFKI